MASWITHLIIAEKLHEKFNFPSLKHFLVGNIAPDSGKVNYETGTYQPPAEISHFKDKHYGKIKIRDLNFYREFILVNKTNNQKELSFFYGYYVHLVVDILWAYFIYLSQKSIYEAEFDKNPKYGWILRGDWHTLAVDYIEDNPDWETWNIFQQSHYDLDCIAFYPPEFINEKLQIVKGNFEKKDADKEVKRFLTADDWKSFNTVAIHLLIDVLSNIEDIEASSNGSILEYLRNKYSFMNKSFGNIKEAQISLSLE